MTRRIALGLLAALALSASSCFPTNTSCDPGWHSIVVGKVIECVQDQ